MTASMLLNRRTKRELPAELDAKTAPTQDFAETRKNRFVSYPPQSEHEKETRERESSDASRAPLRQPQKPTRRTSPEHTTRWPALM